jgi:hypothetical protein
MAAESLLGWLDMLAPLLRVAVSVLTERKALYEDIISWQKLKKACGPLSGSLVERPAPGAFA